MTSPADLTVLFGSNAGFVEALYEDYLADPQAVDADWRKFFDGQVNGARGQEVAHSPVQRAFYELAQRGPQAAAAPAPSGHGVSGLINAYRFMGHLKAKFNPLHLAPPERVPELDPAYHGLTDLDMPVQDGALAGSLRQVIQQLEDTYCRTIGFEFGYLPRTEREWLQARIEPTRAKGGFDATVKRQILNKLTAAEGLERYLHQRYVGQKRFSLEGGETMIPMLDQTIRNGGKRGVQELIMGMAHRGRLNVLVNVFGKQPSELFAAFEGKTHMHPGISGDVKYHMGFSSDQITDGGPVHLALAFNPSHLEIIDPVIEGSARARQDRRNDVVRDQVVAIQIHGDAAVGGQGVVAETLNMSQLRGFTTGGSLHLVINNQVGFSVSDPRDARSSRYCTDIAKFVDAPVFHVNGDDPEAAVYAQLLALEYRMTFHKDVFIDLVCFRKHGHNESDEPRATQPIMYQQIDKHPGSRAVYAQQLEAEGVLQPGEADQLAKSFRDQLDAGQRVAEAVPTSMSHQRPPHSADWTPYLGTSWTAPVSGSVSVSQLQELGRKLTTVPDGFKLHPRVEQIVKTRREMTEGKAPLDWGFAENLAYATLVTAQHPVRLTGQDSGRGTFFHRHAVLYDNSPAEYPGGNAYVPMQHLADGQARFDVIDSTLSEEAVLAFEFGYSTTEPTALVIWEAQYGDFANMAQAIIDQFISAGEVKWQRLSGLVLMLPHGYEGQGPEHSSARLERFMQLCAEDNMQVCVPSTPAQLFHMLRRQVLRPYRKPLIYMSPKSMLRLKASVSSLEELANGRFQELIPDARDTKATRVVLCSGKLYWDLLDERTKKNLDQVALVRIEQLYPFPEEALRTELARHDGAQVVWAQEEPYNQGAWLLIQDDLRACLAPGQTLHHATRPRSASPAVGYPAKHTEQQVALLADALEGAAVNVHREQEVRS
ncbi:MAG: 2-oxoglutarate dehydrogenase, subunit [Cyanobacteria bacterium RYN_339]|nr:2-oxoglutarate dehydrogenase, subunit [Cyanobacteria bacterium RYN_339]